MSQNHTDILISGAGLAGMIAAYAFGNAGFRVVCVDPFDTAPTDKPLKADLRSTAFLQPAQKTLENIGVWNSLVDHATPIQIMRLADAGAETHKFRAIADFKASEISEKPFAWNLPNTLLRHHILDHLKNLKNVTLLNGIYIRQIVQRLNAAHIELSNQDRMTCKLIIAADGRTSPTRDMAGIDTKTWQFGQTAISFSVSHPEPHHNISTEIHRSGGPFTFVPLQQLNGRHCSAIVWMERNTEATKLMALDENAFAQAATERSCHALGDLKLETKRATWPIISRLADRITAPRLALIAEAAHVVPPIGAQGLNMSLADIQCLLNLAQNTPSDLGGHSMLEAYHKARYRDIQTRVHGVNLLNRAAMTDTQILKDARMQGLKILHGITPLRKTIMKKGLGLI